MAEKLTLDTNVLIYAVDQSEPARLAVAQQVLLAAARANVLLTAITLGEFFHVSMRKSKASPTVVKQSLQDWSVLFPVISYGIDDVSRAAVESDAGRFEFWDGVMLSAAERAGCTICLSEDMQDGAKLGGITVRNPFGPTGLSSAAHTALGLP